MQRLNFHIRLRFRPHTELTGPTGVLLEKFRESGWIQPLYDRHSLVLFSARQLAHFVARLEAGDKPGHEGKLKVGVTDQTHVVVRGRNGWAFILGVDIIDYLLHKLQDGFRVTHGKNVVMQVNGLN